MATDKENASFRSTAGALPRKVLVATTMASFHGTAAQRTAQALSLIAQAAEIQTAQHGRRLDLVVLPEYAIQQRDGGPVGARAVALGGPELTQLMAAARRYGCYLIVPAMLAPRGSNSAATNSAVLLDRMGNVAGVYDKVHPVCSADGTLEGGITPGTEYPVFDCDFGRIGIQICWDMCYEEGWLALAERGAELVALCSASPQTVRPAMYALRGPYHVVTSTPRDNATFFSPIGTVLAQTTDRPVLVHEIDLAYAILHWSATLDEGRALTRRFGPRIGYAYSPREDTGVFWSNDPQTPVRTMIQELGLVEMGQHIAASTRAVQALQR